MSDTLFRVSFAVLCLRIGTQLISKPRPPPPPPPPGKIRCMTKPFLRSEDLHYDCLAESLDNMRLVHANIKVADQPHYRASCTVRVFFRCIDNKASPILNSCFRLFLWLHRGLYLTGSVTVSSQPDSKVICRVFRKILYKDV